MILLLDNYDSFVFNLARYLRELGEQVEVARNDALDVAGIRHLDPSHIVISPGPRTPTEAGISVQVIRELGEGTPILGVCLGHQCIGEAFGGKVVRAPVPMHGKTSPVHHQERGLFRGLPNPLRATRYHSLLVELRSGEPDPAAADEGPLRVTACTEEGEVMGLEHVRFPVWGVQFHPEAIMTQAGHALLANFLALGRGAAPPGPEGVSQSVASELEGSIP
ncbi:MAG: anthranilate synthase component II [Gemmatimonadota bacterium]